MRVLIKQAPLMNELCVCDWTDLCTDWSSKCLPGFQHTSSPTLEKQTDARAREPPPSIQPSSTRPCPLHNEQARLNRTTSSRMGDKMTHYLYVNKVFCQRLMFLSQGSGPGTGLRNRCKELPFCPNASSIRTK